MSEARPAIDVAVAVIVSSSNVLLSLRHDHQDQGGLWEFPGGKVEHGESPLQALYRECQEELSIKVEDPSSFIQIWFDYQAYTVLLHVYYVTQFVGQPRGVEGQAVEWVSMDRLSEYPLPAANESIVSALSMRFALA